ncbi:bdd25db5-f25b-4225-af5f-17b53912e20b [Sclerotinia trifoliorum]|uniref:Bdd25db5-f25b-4225-af5f-17b53912e20b n=1 Tax=Sclerotinia trifoliorum TaxID=28548 RepID=A0A8H2VXG7_9HELO|nr:bdd25db5-f25b-4225-af5f-17b53912e20b [Sclerotinia trifoliorum]
MGILKISSKSSTSYGLQSCDRVVVQSPVRNITNESAIPVRRFNGDEENSVYFMPVQDIEKDGSVAYKNAMVSSKSTLIDTHGVALFRSVSDFDYQPGDRFWLFIGPERNDDEKDVPVINHGSGWLSSSEAWPLFAHIYKNMIKDRLQIFSPLLPPPQSSTWAGSSILLSGDLYTPPVSPCMDNSKPLGEHSSPEPMRRSKKTDMAARDSILDLASKGTSRPLRCSIIHPQRSPSSRDRRKYRRTDVNDTWSDSGCSENTARPSTKSPSLTMENGNIRPCSDYLRKSILAQDGEDIMSALRQTDVVQGVAKQITNSRIQDSEQPVLSAAYSDLRTNPSIISTRHQIKKNMATVEDSTLRKDHTAKLCDLRKGDCEWSLRSVSKHYHPDHKKCVSGKRLPKHQHCISSLRALPNTAGSCLIEGLHEHECCVWEDEDMKDQHTPIKKELYEAKIAEARKNIMDSDRLNIKIPDQIIDGSKNIKEEPWIPPMPEEVLDGYGKWLKDEIEKGYYLDKVFKLGKMKYYDHDQD